MILRGESRPEFLREETLHEILTATATRCPQKNALLWEDSKTTYEELLSRANLGGGALAALGASPGQIVGLLLPRGLDLLVAQAAITASGAAWLPFDAEVPLDRAATCLEASGAIGLVTTKAWAHRTNTVPVPVWYIEDLLAPATTRVRPTSPAPNSPAYVIYTSGSTGTPKGIAVSQSNICHFLRSENHTLAISSDDIVYQGFSLAFDMSFEEIWISYLVGSTIWIAPPAVVSDPEALSLIHI
jgi:non-ribosomal peptide synthetase component F